MVWVWVTGAGTKGVCLVLMAAMYGGWEGSSRVLEGKMWRKWRRRSGQVVEWQSGRSGGVNRGCVGVGGDGGQAAAPVSGWWRNRFGEKSPIGIQTWWRFEGLVVVLGPGGPAVTVLERWSEVGGVGQRGSG